MNILLSGYYGFDNTGDEAILLAITRELVARGHRVNVLSNAPGETARTYGVRAAPRLHPLSLLSAVASCDLLLSGGGGLLQDGTSARTLTYYLGLIRLAKRLGKKAAVFNQSAGPLSAAGGRRVALALRGVPTIVRDKGSLETLRALGVAAQLGGDPALLLEPGRVSRDPARVVLAPRGGQRGATEKLAEVANRLRQRGREVVALSLQPQLDDPEARLIGGELVSTNDPQVALDTIAGASYAIGVRLHAVILAAAAGVPFAGVSYDPKVAGFCADAGAAHHPTDLDVDALLGEIGTRLPDWDAVAAMRARARESFDWVLGTGDSGL